MRFGIERLVYFAMQDWLLQLCPLWVFLNTFLLIKLMVSILFEYVQIAYTYTTLSNVGELAEIMSVTFGVIQAIYKATCFILYRNEIKYLLINIQKLVDERKAKREGYRQSRADFLFFPKYFLPYRIRKRSSIKTVCWCKSKWQSIDENLFNNNGWNDFITCPWPDCSYFVSFLTGNNYGWRTSHAIRSHVNFRKSNFLWFFLP